jgi:hypothetical protein
MNKAIVLLGIFLVFASSAYADFTLDFDDDTPDAQCHEINGGVEVVETQYLNNNICIVGETDGVEYSKSTAYTCTSCFYDPDAIQIGVGGSDRGLMCPKPTTTSTMCDFGCNANTGLCNENQVPEFGLVAGLIAITGACTGYLILRRKN